MRELLRDCSTIERLAEEIYRQLAADATYAGRVRETFARLAQDERDHARQIDNTLDVPAGKLDAVTRIAWRKVDEALQKVRRLHRDVGSRGLSEEEALRLAVTLEQDFIKVHLDNALHFFDRRTAALFEDLARSDEAHLASLRECLEWWHRQRSMDSPAES
jgi:rubrerythrin